MDINNLPDINFCETDASQIESTVITAYESIAGVSLAKGDPVRLFLESFAFFVAQERLVIDQAGKQNLLRYAEEGYLDHLGAFLGVGRLPKSAATTTIRFSVDAAVGWAVTIPAGTRVTPDGKLMFATSAASQIAPGETFVDVSAVCETLGAVGTGFVAGQINRLVDPIAYIVSVENLTTSLGGADIESDDRLRERIRLAPESFSVAGPSGAYIYWAKTASQNIIDISVFSPSPGLVQVYPLMVGGDLPQVEDIAAVESTLNDETIRPLCDLVEVRSPSVVGYDLTATYYISRADTAMVAQIQESVDMAVSTFIAWQRSKLGRDINPSKLIADMLAAGAKRVELVTPVYRALDYSEVAQEGTVSVAYGGVEDE